MVVSSDLWKNEPKKIGSKEPWKLQILTSKSSPRAQGAALRTRKGPVPWPNIGLCPNPSSPEGRKRAQLPPFLLERMFREPYVNRLSRHILTDGCAACSGIPRFYWQQLRSDPAVPVFCMFRMVCWPRKISICHLPGMLSAPWSIPTSLRTLYLLCLCGRRKL